MIMVRKQEIPCRDPWSNSLWEPATGGKADAPPAGAAEPVYVRRVPPANEQEIAALVQSASVPAPAPVPPVEDVVLSEARVVSTYEPDWAAPRLATPSSQTYDAGDAIKKAREAYRGRIKPDKSKWIAPPLSPPAFEPAGASTNEDADEPTVVERDRRSPRLEAVAESSSHPVEPPESTRHLDPVGVDPTPTGAPAEGDDDHEWSALSYDEELEDERTAQPEPANRSFWRGGSRRRTRPNLGRFASLRWTVDHGAAADHSDEETDREWAEPTAEVGGEWPAEVGDVEVAEEPGVGVAEHEDVNAHPPLPPVAATPPIILLPVGPELSPELPRVCRTCRDFRPAEGGDRGWCANTWAFTHRRVVAAADATPCETSFGNWWLPVDDVWADGADVSDHGRPTPLLDGWMPRVAEQAAQRRRS